MPGSPISAIKQQKENNKTPSTHRTHIPRTHESRLQRSPYCLLLMGLPPLTRGGAQFKPKATGDPSPSPHWNWFNRDHAPAFSQRRHELTPTTHLARLYLNKQARISTRRAPARSPRLWCRGHNGTMRDGLLAYTQTHNPLPSKTKLNQNTAEGTS